MLSILKSELIRSKNLNCPLLTNLNYTKALSKLVALRTPIDAFFENVMVMADDAKIIPISYN